MSPSLPGWLEIQSGIGLIRCSRLAHREEIRLVADTDRDSFNAYWSNLDPKYGRWFCWLAFCVGAESIGKGAFGLNGQLTSTMAQFKNWERHLGMSVASAKSVRFAFARLKSIRDNEAHEFRVGVRDAYFNDVEESLVPALNEVLNCLNQEELRRQVLVA